MGGGGIGIVWLVVGFEFGALVGWDGRFSFWESVKGLVLTFFWGGWGGAAMGSSGLDFLVSSKWNPPAETRDSRAGLLGLDGKFIFVCWGIGGGGFEVGFGAFGGINFGDFSDKEDCEVFWGCLGGLG